MKQRGRQSTQSKDTKGKVIDIAKAMRPRPPEGLTKEQRVTWNEITESRPPDFFDTATIPLLAEYCRLVTQLDQLAVPLAKYQVEWFNTEEGLKRYKTLADLQEKGQKRLLLLATKMRLTQQSRYTKDSARARPVSKPAARPWESDA